MWVVVYAKIIDDKDVGIKLASVSFGGVADDKSGAELIARECVNTIKGGTIMPRVYELSGNYNLPKVMYDAEQMFKKKEEEMIIAAEIIARQSRHK